MFAATIVLFLILAPFAQAQYSGGMGEPNDPYQIATAEDLMLLGESPGDYDKHFILIADIDLDPNLPGGIIFDRAVIAPDMNDITGEFQGTAFTGVFDGNGHTVLNFSYTSTEIPYVGLFGYMEGAEIRDLGLLNPNIDAGTGDYVGSLAGYIKRSTIKNCYAEGVIVVGHNSIGGLIGNSRFESRGITNCHATGSVTGNENVGGLVGFNDYSRISDCYAIGTVVGDCSVGGLVGVNGGSFLGYRSVPGGIFRSYANATVYGCDDVGGLVGRSDYYATITNCYATGGVTGIQHVGGLVGGNVGYITTTYSTSTVSGTGSNVGGLLGYNEEPNNTSNSFWDIETSGQEFSAGGVGLTTAEMQDPETFIAAEWDFHPHDIWIEPEGGGYPVLFWQVPPEFGLPDFAGGKGDPNDPYLKELYSIHEEKADKLAEKLWDLNSKEFDNQWTHITATVLSGAFEAVFKETYGAWRESLKK